jgi:hypothetical protein
VSQYLKLLFENDDRQLEFFSKHPQRGINRSFRTTPVGATENLKELERQGFDNFVCINTGVERSNTGITHYHCIFLDVDFRKGQKCPKNLPLPPSLAVKTGGGWHIYWLLNPGVDVTKWKQTQKAMARKYGPDESVGLATQLARLPGYKYHKAPTDRLGPSYKNQLIINPNALNRRFDLDEFQKSLTLELEPRPIFIARESARSDFGCASIRAKQYLARMIPAIDGEGGSLQTFKACKVGVDFGVEEDEFWPLLLEFNQRCNPPWKHDELSHKLSSAYRCKSKPFGWRMQAE